MIILLLSHGMDRQSLVDHHSVSQTLEIKHFSVICGLVINHVDYIMRQLKVYRNKCKLLNYFLSFVVPSSASTVTSTSKTLTTITVNWTALDSSDADGYVVNVTCDTDTVQTVQVEGSSNNTITLNGLRGGTTYNITVRAYQQLLGPASTISVQTLPAGIATAPVNVLVTLLMYF